MSSTEWTDNINAIDVLRFGFHIIQNYREPIGDVSSWLVRTTVHASDMH